MKARIGWQGLTKKEYLNSGNFYLITGTDFLDGTIDFRNCHYVNEDRYAQDANIQINNDDISNFQRRNYWEGGLCRELSTSLQHLMLVSS